jgi:hypothetical protein
MNPKNQRRNNMEEPRPEFVTEEHLQFLDQLRESGEINMFGAAPYLAEFFDLTQQEARKVLAYWMQTFSSRKGKNKPPLHQHKET